MGKTQQACGVASVNKGICFFGMKLFAQFHREKPFWTLSNTNNPNRRWQFTYVGSSVLQILHLFSEAQYDVTWPTVKVPERVRFWHEKVHNSANHISAFLSRRVVIGWEVYFSCQNRIRSGTLTVQSHRLRTLKKSQNRCTYNSQKWKQLFANVWAFIFGCRRAARNVLVV